ncbi:MAG: isoprenyl transferase [Candidatus Brocadiae bacterium]|nr:isoprenyl transferase [Candidatus Brocadiia bacterium]
MDLTFRQLPRHIAIIMDGNGRWAKQKNKPRIWGHKAGATTVDIITKECSRLGIQQLTLYAFSHENWQRPKEEIDYLMTLLRRFLIKERKTIMENNIRFNTIGHIHRLPKTVIDELDKTKEMSAKNTGMTLCLALSYGGRMEIVDVVKKIAQRVAQGEIQIDDINEEMCSQSMYQPGMPDLDLLIRTGGEMRISNFLLWQLSYSELWITPTLWPDFNEQELHKALEDFEKRERRFGKVL